MTRTANRAAAPADLGELPDIVEDATVEALARSGHLVPLRRQTTPVRVAVVEQLRARLARGPKKTRRQGRR